MKSLLASVENEGIIESFIFTLIFDKTSTNNKFSGLIYKHDIEGNFLKVYKYTNGKKKYEGVLKTNSSNSNKNTSLKDTPSLADCFGGLTADDLVWMAEVGFESNNLLDCIEITGSGGSSSTDDSTYDNLWSDPDFNLSSSTPIIGSNTDDTSNTSTNGTSLTTNIPAPTAPIDDTWYSEENPAEAQLAIKVIENNLTLSNDQINWVNNPNNAWNVISIYNFFKTNGYSQEAKDVAIIAINTNSVKYINQNFNFTKKSPFNVDMTKVLDSISLPERDSTKIANEKFLCIYEKLTASPTFQNLFINTFGDSDKFDVKFEIVNNIAGNGTTSGSATVLSTGALSSINLSIKLSESKIISNSSLSVARTILHESIHAYLDLKKYNCDAGTTLEYLNNKTLGEIINEFYDDFNCAGNQSQHDFMFSYMLPTLEQCLSEIKDVFVPESHQGLAENTTILDSGLGINESFNWDKFYYYFSMSGLHQSETFINNIENNSKEFTRFKQYTSVGQTFSQTFPCNE